MSSQRKRTYYTDAKVATAARNLEQHEWAREERRRVIGAANKWLTYDDARLRTLVPPPEVPRAYAVHEKGAPIHGDELLRRGPYSWIISFDEPWKIKSPVDGRVYPSNDFAAFMASGFNDRSLLTGPYADDGWGCEVEGVPHRFWFAAYYAQWSISLFLRPALGDLSKAYLLTDDARYAHACAVLLWQMAEHYPGYFYEKQSRTGTEFNVPHKGRMLDCIWETDMPRVTGPAYDAIRQVIDSDAALIGMTGQTGAQIREHIEDRLLRTMVNDIMDGSGRIQGNYGFHQLALIVLASVLEGSPKAPTSEAMIEWILDNPDARNYTQLGMADAVNNLLHRDGYPFESPHYSNLWLKNMGLMAEGLGPRARDFLAKPRFRKLFDWPLAMTVAGEFTPAHGDTGGMFHERLNYRHGVEVGYRLYRDPALARQLRGHRDELEKDLFRDPLDIGDVAADRVPERDVRGRVLPGVGFASLQTGGRTNRTGLALLYGDYWGHRHFDLLHLDLYAQHNALTPDFGYPETADFFSLLRYGFTSNTVAHNTVVIDARRQAKARGRLHLFDPGAFVQVAEFSAEGCYPGRAELYRRTLMLVELNPDQAYVVDIFRVRGGEQHDWVVHGTQADFQSDLPFSKPRKEGTLAGPDVPYGFYYDDDRYRGEAADIPNYLYEGSGFQFLTSVQEARLSRAGTASWHLNRPEGLKPNRPGRDVVLRAHLLGAHRDGKEETVFACDGRPQRHETWPETVKFLVRRRHGPDLESVFVTVFEPYRRTPFMDSARLLPTDARDDLAVALEIRCGGTTHVVFNRLESEGAGRSTLTLPDDSLLDARAAAVERDADGKLARTYLLDDAGTKFRGNAAGPARGCRATVKAVDYETGEITLSEPVLSGAPAGGIAVVESARHADAVQVGEIRGADTFSVGDEDLSAGTVRVSAVQGNRVEFEPKYVTFVEPGMTVVNEAGRAVGRVESIEEGVAVVASPGPLSVDDFPDVNGDGRRTCRFMVVGPGDSLALHTSWRSETAGNGRR